MGRVLFKTIVLCATVLALAVTGYSQTIECDCRVHGGSGNFNGAAPCPPLDYIYKIVFVEPAALETLYIGTHDGILANYTDICLPPGYTLSVVPTARPDLSGFIPKGSIAPSPNGTCPFTLVLNRGPIDPGAAIYFGFNHSGTAHEVSWQLDNFPPPAADWSKTVGDGLGPVHGPLGCDSLGTIYYGDGDCNVDGNVLTAADMAYLNAFLHGSAALPSELYHSDLNGDCVVDSNDYRLYQNYFTFGISVFAPYGGYPVPTCCSVAVVIYPGSSLSNLCGMKFEDLDCDGFKTPGELPLTNWPIYLYQGANQIASTTTNGNGEYCFMNLTPGTYKVREAYLPGWTQTYPATVSYTVTPVAGQTIPDLDFGNTKDSCDSASITQVVNQVAGIKDNFSVANGPEPSSPGAEMAGLCGGNANNFFDSPQINNCFGHTFSGFKNDSCCVIAAELCLRITPSDGGSPNDGISIVENGVYVWGLSLSTLWWYHTGGADSTWDTGDTLDTCLNLANLPPGTADAGGIGTNVMATLHDGDFSVRFQDDTKIDFLEIKVTLCCPGTIGDSLGACCLLDGSCVPGVTAFQCDSISGGSGVFFNGVTCVPNPCTPDSGGEACESFTVRCCDGKPSVAKRSSSPNFSGQVAVASCYTNYPTTPTDSPYVVSIVDLTTQCTAPTGTPGSNPQGFTPPIYYNKNTPTPNPTNDPLDEWTRVNLGTVFGLTLDTLGNIYVAQTSCYSGDDFSNTYGSHTGGDIYKLDGTTGNISFVANFPNSGQGLGDVSYDCHNDLLFVSDMENGLIYTIRGVSSATPTLATPYDHGVDGRTAASLSTIPDDGLTGSPNSNTGFTQLGRRIWALQAVNGLIGTVPFSKLFYSVWWEDFGNVDPVEQNEIWSVQLDPGTGNILPGTAKLELKMPSFKNTSTSGPVSDISFTADGRMILAERTMYGGSSPGAHSSRLLSYDCVNGLWARELTGSPVNDIYQILYGAAYPSSAGGVDFDDRTGYFPSACQGRVWGTGDALRIGTINIYGLAGFPKLGGNSTNNTDCILIDLDAEFTNQDKTEIGDVEIPCRCCRGNRGDVNGDGADANILDLTYMVDRIFRGGPAVPCLEEADVNGDGSINILDLTFLVDRIFRGGPAPGPCPQCCTD